MPDKVTFKDYYTVQLESSKQQLVALLNKTPTITETYTVTTYCRLMVGRTIDDNESVPLKPGREIAIKWLHENDEDPIPQKIEIKSTESVDEHHAHELYWSPTQLIKWLSKNTK